MTYKPKVIDGVFFLETIINFELGAYNDVKPSHVTTQGNS